MRLLDAIGRPAARRDLSHNHRLVAASHFSVSTKPLAFDAATDRLGRLPALAATSAVGLLLVAVADTRARENSAGADLLFWLGLLALFIPIAIRVVSRQAGSEERVTLVCMLAVGMYLAALFRSPIGVGTDDEFMHLRTLRDVLESHHLFTPNPLLPISPRYPGLEILTSAVISLTGLPSFVAGLLVIALGRLVLVLALYLFFQEVSGSDQIAATASVIYMANPNLFYLDSAISYESLALGFAALVLYLVVRWQKSGDRGTIMAVSVAFVTVAVVTTHHVSSYALAGFLTLWAVVAFVRRPPKLASADQRQDSWLAPAAAACMTLIGIACWLSFVAQSTLDYLVPVIVGGVDQVVQQISGQVPFRTLFENRVGQVAPPWERVLGFGAVLLVLSALPFGLLNVWRRHRASPVFLALGLWMLGYPLSLAVRLSSVGQEAGSRATEFVFIGIAPVLAGALVEAWAPGLRRLQGSEWMLPSWMLGTENRRWPGSLISPLVKAFKVISGRRSRMGSGLISAVVLEWSAWFIQDAAPSLALVLGVLGLLLLLLTAWATTRHDRGPEGRSHRTALDDAKTGAIRNLSRGKVGAITRSGLALHGGRLPRRPVSFPVATTAADRGLRTPSGGAQRAIGIAAFAAWIGVILVGNVIVGEEGWARLPGPFAVNAQARSVQLESIDSAQWMVLHRGPRNRIATDKENRLQFGSYGDQNPVANFNYTTNITDIFFDPTVDEGVVSALRKGRIRYVVVDRRLSTGLPYSGYYYELSELNRRSPTKPIDARLLDKFASIPNVSLVYNSGNIQVYDVRALSGAA